jgi:hypothetical protein
MSPSSDTLWEWASARGFEGNAALIAIAASVLSLAEAVVRLQKAVTPAIEAFVSKPRGD